MTQLPLLDLLLFCFLIKYHLRLAIRSLPCVWVAAGLGTKQAGARGKACSHNPAQPGPPRAVLKATVSGELVQIYTLKSGRYPPTSGSRIALSGGDTSSSVLSPSAGLGGAGSNYPQQPCSWTLSHGLKTLLLQCLCPAPALSSDRSHSLRVSLLLGNELPSPPCLTAAFLGTVI